MAPKASCLPIHCTLCVHIACRYILYTAGKENLTVFPDVMFFEQTKFLVCPHGVIVMNTE